MKKTATKKLTLSSETLRILDGDSPRAARAAGADGTAAGIFMRPNMSIVWTECNCQTSTTC